MPERWIARCERYRRARLKVQQRSTRFAPAGVRVLSPNARLIEAYMVSLPIGERRTVRGMMVDLAAESGADRCCPITTSLLARLLAEVSVAKLRKGYAEHEIVPFWRVISDQCPSALRLSCGPDLISMRRAMEAQAIA